MFHSHDVMFQETHIVCSTVAYTYLHVVAEGDSKM